MTSKYCRFLVFKRPCKQCSGRLPARQRNTHFFSEMFHALLKNTDMFINPLALNLEGYGVCGTSRFDLDPKKNNGIKGYVLVATPKGEVLTWEQLDIFLYRLNITLRDDQGDDGVSLNMTVWDAENDGEVEDYWFEHDPRDFLVLAHVEYNTTGTFPRTVYRTAVLAFDQAREDVLIDFYRFSKAPENMHNVLANDYPRSVRGVYKTNTMFFNNFEW